MTSTVAMTILSELWPTLRKHVLSIGRWLLRVAVRHGRDGLAVYMECRVEVFDERLKRAKSKQRRRWLRGRIRRWSIVIAWLHGREAENFTEKVIDLAHERAKREIPAIGPDESFGRWLRKVHQR